MLPLLALPYPLLHNVINQLNLYELIELSFASSRCRRVVQSLVRIKWRIKQFEVINAKLSHVRITVDKTEVMFAVHSSFRDDPNVLELIGPKEINKSRKVFDSLDFEARRISPTRIIDFWRKSSQNEEKNVHFSCYMPNREQVIVEIADYLMALFGKPPKMFSIKLEGVKHLEPLLTSLPFRTSFIRQIHSESPKKKLTCQEMSWIMEAPLCNGLDLRVTPHRNFELNHQLRVNMMLVRKAEWVKPHMIIDSFRHCEVIMMNKAELVTEEVLNQVVKRWLAGFDRLTMIRVFREKMFDASKIYEGIFHYKTVYPMNEEVRMIRRADGRVAGVGTTGHVFKFKVWPPRPSKR